MNNQDKLIAEAAAARELAYTPYSKFKVGAALECKDGRIFRGCNVENASYGLCNCAERTAFFSAIAAGYKPGDFVGLAVIGQTDGPIAPCGACRQVILEFGRAEVTSTCSGGTTRRWTAQELLPGAFALRDRPA